MARLWRQVSGSPCLIYLQCRTPTRSISGGLRSRSSCGFATCCDGIRPVTAAVTRHGVSGPLREVGPDQPLDKAGDEHGVANQLADQRRVADARGFSIVRAEVDNDISALNGKHRPGYEAVMAAAARREIDVILVFQTSRFWRNRRERTEGIEILPRGRLWT